MLHAANVMYIIQNVKYTLHFSIISNLHAYFLLMR